MPTSMALSKPTRGAHSCRFFRLPRELRDKIYSLLDLRRNSKAISHLLIADEVVLKGIPFPNIFLVSKQFRREYAQVLDRQRRAPFPIDVKMRILPPLERHSFYRDAMSPRLRRQLEHHLLPCVTEVKLEVKIYGDEIMDENGAPSCVMALLKELPSLREMTLVFVLDVDIQRWMRDDVLLQLAELFAGWIAECRPDVFPRMTLRSSLKGAMPLYSVPDWRSAYLQHLGMDLETYEAYAWELMGLRGNTVDITGNLASCADRPSSFKGLVVETGHAANELNENFDKSESMLAQKYRRVKGGRGCSCSDYECYWDQWSANRWHRGWPSWLRADL